MFDAVAATCTKAIGCEKTQCIGKSAHTSEWLELSIRYCAVILRSQTQGRLSYSMLRSLYFNYKAKRTIEKLFLAGEWHYTLKGHSVMWRMDQNTARLEARRPISRLLQ